MREHPRVGLGCTFQGEVDTRTSEAEAGTRISQREVDTHTFEAEAGTPILVGVADSRHLAVGE